MNALLLALVLTISPTARDKYVLNVHGAPRAAVVLRASGAPKGWIASFCTDTVCSPFSWTMQLDGGGAGRVELQLIRTSQTAPHRARITIAAPGAKALIVTGHS